MEEMECKCCGAKITNDEYIVANDNTYFCNAECALRAGYHQCEHCGEWFNYDDDGICTDDDTYFCSNDCAYDEGYECCNYCGDWKNGDSGFFTNDGEYYCCEECVENAGYCICNDCGNVARECMGRYIENFGWVCEECLDNGDYTTCDECGNWYRCDDIEYDDNDDAYYCAECYEALNKNDAVFEKICGWHTKSIGSWLPFGELDDDNTYRFGFELEVEYNGDDDNDDANERTVGKILDLQTEYGLNNFMAFEHDGSLNTGFEIISSPMTPKFFYEHITFFEALLELLKHEDYISHNCSRCGLHFHVSRNVFNNDSLSRLIYLYERNKSYLLDFSRRKIDAHYYKFYFDTTDKGAFTMLDDCKYITRSNGYGDRYHCVNLQNSPTVEIRLYKGTLDFDSFVACAEQVFAFVDYAITNDDTTTVNSNVDDIITNAKYNTKLKEYTMKRGLLKCV